MIGHSPIYARMQKLEALRHLPQGWNFGRGCPVTDLAHMNALAITLMASGVGATKFEYFPEDDGGILVISYRADDSAEILATGGGGFEIAFEDNNGLSPTKECGTFAELRTVLEQHGWQSQRSSGSFTRVITSSERTDTRRWRFDPAKAQSLSLIPGALPQKGIRVVPMQRFTIPAKSEDRRQYSGESKLRNLLLEAS